MLNIQFVHEKWRAEKMESGRGGGRREREKRQQPSTYDKNVSRVKRFVCHVHTADGLETNRSKKLRFTLECTSAYTSTDRMRIYSKHNLWTEKQTSTTSMDTMRSNVSLVQRAVQFVLSQSCADGFIFSRRHDRENKVIGGDLIHICYSRWSLQLLSSNVRLLLWTQTSKSIAYRVRSASLNLRSLLGSLTRCGSLRASLPLPRSRVPLILD